MKKLFSGQNCPYIGKVFHIGNFSVTVEELIAEGGYSLVFLARCNRTGEKYALKRMSVNDSQGLQNCKKEIRVAQELSQHKNIITVVSTSINSIKADIKEILILMEYCRVHVLQLMNQNIDSGFGEMQVMKIFCNMCEAVAMMHHHNPPIIHRDLKVENILYRSQTDDFVLCDFGSATPKGIKPSEHPSIPQLEEEIKRITTTAYRSPEMIDLYSDKLISTKADIWALGCMLYKLCFFSMPFGENVLAMQNGNFTIPATSKFSNDLHKLIRFMLIVDADLRPDIFQVSYVAFKLMNLPCPISNVNSVTAPENLPDVDDYNEFLKRAIGSSNENATKPQVNVGNPIVVTATSIAVRERPRPTTPINTRKHGNSQRTDDQAEISSHGGRHQPGQRVTSNPQAQSVPQTSQHIPNSKSQHGERSAAHVSQSGFHQDRHFDAVSQPTKQIHQESPQKQLRAVQHVSQNIPHQVSQQQIQQEVLYRQQYAMQQQINQTIQQFPRPYLGQGHQFQTSVIQGGQKPQSQQQQVQHQQLTQQRDLQQIDASHHGRTQLIGEYDIKSLLFASQQQQLFAGNVSNLHQHPNVSTQVHQHVTARPMHQQVPHNPQMQQAVSSVLHVPDRSHNPQMQQAVSSVLHVPERPHNPQMQQPVSSELHVPEHLRQHRRQHSDPYRHTSSGTGVSLSRSMNLSSQAVNIIPDMSEMPNMTATSAPVSPANSPPNVRRTVPVDHLHDTVSGNTLHQVTQQAPKPDTNQSRQQRDLFGAAPFGSSESQSSKDLFGASPFANKASQAEIQKRQMKKDVSSKDMFGSVPFDAAHRTEAVNINDKSQLAGSVDLFGSKPFAAVSGLAASSDGQQKVDDSGLSGPESKPQQIVQVARQGSEVFDAIPFGEELDEFSFLSRSRLGKSEISTEPAPSVKEVDHEIDAFVSVPFGDSIGDEKLRRSSVSSSASNSSAENSSCSEV